MAGRGRRVFPYELSIGGPESNGSKGLSKCGYLRKTGGAAQYWGGSLPQVRGGKSLDGSWYIKYVSTILYSLISLISKFTKSLGIWVSIQRTVNVCDGPGV